jgi:hypothetical protein
MQDYQLTGCSELQAWLQRRTFSVRQRTYGPAGSKNIHASQLLPCAKKLALEYRHIQDYKNLKLIRYFQVEVVPVRIPFHIGADTH